MNILNHHQESPGGCAGRELMVEVVTPSKDINIVVIDDSEASCRRIKDYSSKDGYDVCTYTDPEKALDAIFEKKPDLIILDDVMPHINGFEILRILKGKDETSAIPIIFISSLREIDERTKAIKLGAEDCIVRPVNERELRVKVRNFLHLNKLKNEILNRERLASIGRLAGGIAHEINNPLTGVITNLQLLKKEIDRFIKKIFHLLEEKSVENEVVQNMKKELLEDNVIKEKLSKYITTAIDGAQRCSNVVSNLLEYSKPVRKEKIVAVEWKDVIESALSLLKKTIDDNNISVNMNFSEKKLCIKCSLWEAKQIAISILMNAVQASSQTRKRTININEYIDGEFIALEVSDSGYGISREKVNSIFDYFYTTRAEGEGFGLGLSVVNQIVMKYGGKLSIETSEGEGTAIRIYLPPYK
ncbi:MAG: hybrid sensor histidine kinase/response regulator [Candidatus Schekmanbacteria bacterium]|nr:MAG: hybrid sensor histidine kinase/response regulator [Candidatus Schekmanbacteria bacterium]